MTINENTVSELIQNNNTLYIFLNELSKGYVDKWAIDEYIYFFAKLSYCKRITRVCHQYDLATMWRSETRIVWWGQENPETLSMSDAYNGSLMVTRLISCCLITILKNDASKYNDLRFIKLLASSLDVCAIYGLKYMTQDDLQMTVDAFNTAKVLEFVKQYPDICKPFTTFILDAKEHFIQDSDCMK